MSYLEISLIVIVIVIIIIIIIINQSINFIIFARSSIRPIASLVASDRRGSGTQGLPTGQCRSHVFLLDALFVYISPFSSSPFDGPHARDDDRLRLRNGFARAAQGTVSRVEGARTRQFLEPSRQASGPRTRVGQVAK